MSVSSSEAHQAKMVILMVAGLPITLLLAATWLWYFVVNGDLDLIGALGTANNGDLVQPPRQLENTAFISDTGAEVHWSDLEAQWTLLVPVVGSRCDVACSERLYFTRQIHIALGREFNRVRRVMVLEQPLAAVRVDSQPEATEAGNTAGSVILNEPLVEYAQREQRGLRILETAPDNITALFSEISQDPNHWYLVDSAGWVMMRYNDSIDYKSVLKDLKFLLKNSGGDQ